MSQLHKGKTRDTTPNPSAHLQDLQVRFSVVPHKRPKTLWVDDRLHELSIVLERIAPLGLGLDLDRDGYALAFAW